MRVTARQAAKLSYAARTILTFWSLIKSSALRAGDDKAAGSAQVEPKRVHAKGLAQVAARRFARVLPVDSVR
jgi:hypothetical protein